MLDIDRINPATYAERLAGYIADPSTIRARTMESFGRAPSIAEIERMRAKRFPVKVERQWPCGHDRVDENTAWLPRDREGCLMCHKAAQAALTAKQRARQEKAAADKARRDELARKRLENYAAKRLAKMKVSDDLQGVYFTDELIAQVADAFMITREVLLGSSRFPREVCARSVVARILSERGKLSSPQIARRLNKDCHSTILHLLATWESRAKRFPEMQLVYEALK